MVFLARETKKECADGEFDNSGGDDVEEFANEDDLGSISLALERPRIVYLEASDEIGIRYVVHVRSKAEVDVMKTEGTEEREDDLDLLVDPPAFPASGNSPLQQLSTSPLFPQTSIFPVVRRIEGWSRSMSRKAHKRPPQ